MSLRLIPRIKKKEKTEPGVAVDIVDQA